MSAEVTPRQAVFIGRRLRRVDALTFAQLQQLRALYLAYDPLELRARLVHAGFQLFARETHMYGRSRLCLAHRRAA
jgi:hypothetical protein